MAVPPNMGGDRRFLVDPQATSLSTMVGDMAALNLQLIHTLEGVIPAGAKTALANRIADQTRQILAASTVSQTRETATRELKPITRVPAAPWGIGHNVANIRMHNVSTFTGSGTDALDVVRWLSRIFTLAEAHTLTFAAAINLMIQGSSGGAADYIEQMKDEGKTIFQIVQQLEMRYGNLCTPEEARVLTNNMARNQGEGLSDFIDRLRSMARMACRMEDDEPTRRQAIDSLVEGNIRRVLPTSVRNALGERVITRSQMGLPAFTAREVEKECLDLERRRDERKTQLTGPGAVKQRGQIHRLEATYAAVTSDESNSSADEADIEDDGTYHLINEIKQVQNRYAKQGRNIEPQKVYRKAFRNFNTKYPVRNPKGQYPYGARQVGQGGNAPGNSNPNQGPPNNLEGQPRKTILELLALANIQKGSCVQCGQQGHYMRADACALRDKLLTDRACAKCGQGLHSADDCLKVYQKQYVAQPPQAIHPVNQSQDHLNGN